MKQIILLLITLALTAAAQTNDTVNYSADKVVYSRKDTCVYLIGNSKFLYNSIVMTADTIAYHSDKRIMIAAGHPLMIDGTDTLTGDYIAYNLKDKTGKVRQGVFNTEDKLLYGGERIARGTDEALYIDNGNYTTSQAVDSIHYYFYGKNIKIIPNKKLYIKPFVLNIEDAPSAVFPLFILPLEKNRRNGLLPIRWGVGINGQGSVDNIGYYWAPNDYVDFMTAAKVDNFTSYILKAETNYALKERLSGSLHGETTLDDKYQGSSNKWSLQFNHNQYILPDNSLTLKGSGSVLSSKDYYTKHSEDTAQIREQSINANASLSKKFNLGYTSINWDRSQNLKTERTETYLPTWRFNLTSLPVIPLKKDPKDTTTSWYEKPTWSYSAVANHRISQSTKTDSTYYNSYSGFSQSIPVNAPFEIFNHFTLTPSAQLYHSVLDAYIDTTKDTSYSHELIYSKMSIKKSREIATKDSIDNHFIVIKDTLYPPEVLDTTIRFNERDTLILHVTQDTTYYGDPAFQMKKANYFWWDAGISLKTTLFGIFPMHVGAVTGIRHSLTPSIGYNFVPKRDLDVQYIPLSGISTPSGTKQQQNIVFSLDNLFEARYLKDSKEKKTSIFNARLSGSYNLEEEKKKWANFALSASIPNSYVDLGYSGSYAPYTRDTVLIFPKPINHSLRVNPRLPSLSGSFWSGDFLTLEKVAHDSYMDGIAKANKTGWSANVSPRYNLTLNRSFVDEPFVQNRTYNLGGGFKFDFSHRWNIRWDGDWSFTEGTFINQSVSLYGDLESWEMKFDWYPSGINGGRFYFLVNVKKHRDIQWMKRQL